MSAELRLESARPEDAPALPRLLESRASGGALDLLYTRRPDPVASLLSEGPDVSLWVIRDEAGTARFMAGCVRRRVFLGGQGRTLPYLCSVRKEAGSLPRVNWLRALCACAGERERAAVCSILEGNEAAQRIFYRRKRPYMPRTEPLCGYRTFLLSPRAVKGRPGEGFFRLTDGDRGELLSFLRREGCRYDGFPAVEHLERELFGLKPGDFYGIRQGGELVSCGALWDQRAYRQYVVREYQGVYVLARQLRFLTRLLGYIPLPPPGETANVRLLTLLCVQGDDAGLFRRLLAGLAGAAAGEGCPILVAGAAEGHPWYSALSSLRSVSFGSTIYTLELPGNTAPLPCAGRPLHLEVGWL